MRPHGNIMWAYRPETVRPRPFEIEIYSVETTHGWNEIVDRRGWSWKIIVRGETIALGLGCYFDWPMDAYYAAKEWAYAHEQMGYSFEKDWWLIAS